MATIIAILHITVCITIIFVILLQSGKGADMGAAFGGSTQTVFGSTGAATFLSKLTTVVAIVFMLTSLSLTLMSAPRATESVMDHAGEPAPRSAPVSSGTTSPTPAASTETQKEQTAQTPTQPGVKHPKAAGEQQKTR